ncbi:MAG: efflux RND transporter periplasmic adaptor subunit [Gammaproteobacteria bacterium]|nr:efflux RND transporter periplasmic adaptor subunit [Gammaproteobacteria bacterium]
MHFTTRLLRFSIPLTFSLVLLQGCTESRESDQTATPPLPEVGVQRVAPQAITITTELAGRAAPYLIAEVRPQVNGIIRDRQFAEGSLIEAGEVLYQIDPAMLEAAYNSAQAALLRDEASLSTAQLKVKRYQKLLHSKAISQEAYDVADAALAEAHAVVAVSKAALDIAKINLDYTKIRSPISGRIGRSAVTAGALVTANQADALATVQQLDPIYIDLSQSYTEILRLRRALANGQLQTDDEIGATVRLALEDGQAYRHPGRLQFSEFSVSEGTGSVTLRAVIPNPEGTLLPGMYVRAIINEGVNPNAILVPQRAVSHNTKGEATALILNDSGEAELRILTVSRSIGNQWLVTAGLQAGERLIVEGMQKVRPGAKAKGVVVAQQSHPGGEVSTVTTH